MADETPAATPAPAEHPKPRTTLQMLILYPSLALALGGSVPTILQHIKAWRLDTTASQVQLVEEQQKLWERNLPCIQEQGSYEVDGPGGIIIRATLCSTGDALIRYHLNAWPPIYKWVALPVEKVKK